VVAVDYFDKELCGDLTDLAGIAQTVRQVKPDVIATPPLTRRWIKAKASVSCPTC
jgi:hypothetical protein